MGWVEGGCKMGVKGSGGKEETEGVGRAVRISAQGLDRWVGVWGWR
jgi:hypothetical protein